jgi:chromosome segregation ATPase
MRKLNATQIKIKNDLATRLEGSAQGVRNEIHAINTYLTEARERLENLMGLHNSLVEDANAFIESVHDEQEGFVADRSEGWSSTDKGEMYQGWADEWLLSLEELEIELPQELEEPDLQSIEDFKALPEAP